MHKRKRFRNKERKAVLETKLKKIQYMEIFYREKRFSTLNKTKEVLTYRYQTT